MREVDVNSWSAILSAIVLGTVGVLSFIIQPGLVQGFVTQLTVPEPEAVNLAGIEMLGVAIATVAVALIGSRLNWRLIISVSLIVAVIGDAGSALTPGEAPFPMYRFIAGLGEGAIISMSFTLVGLTRKAERNLALYLMSLLTYGAFMLWYLPDFLEAVGLAGLFWLFALLSALALAAVPFVPRSFTAEAMPNPEARQLTRRLLIIALAGVLAYNLAQGIAWAILFLVGVEAQITEQRVADALFLSQVVAIAGALASVFLAEKLRRNRAIAFGILAGAASIALLLGQPTALVFTIAVCGFNFLWNFVLPFILARVCDFEESGTMMPFAIAMQMIGLGIGPLLAARMLDGSDYRTVEAICIALFLASYGLLLGPIRAHAKLNARSVAGLRPN